jgi:hypothetical protein
MVCEKNLLDTEFFLQLFCFSPFSETKKKKEKEKQLLQKNIPRKKR